MNLQRFGGKIITLIYQVTYMSDKKMSNKKAILLRELSMFHDQIPDLKEWLWEELDTLKLMSDRIWAGTIRKEENEPKTIPMLLKSFKCSASELRSAIAAQITCADWSEGTDEVQHFATFMLAGSPPMGQYTQKAIELLESYKGFVLDHSNSFSADTLQKLDGAISFITRFK